MLKKNINKLLDYILRIKKMYHFNLEPTIIELKYDPKWCKEILDVTNSLRYRINKNSKYVKTVESILKNFS